MEEQIKSVRAEFDSVRKKIDEAQGKFWKLVSEFHRLKEEIEKSRKTYSQQIQLGNKAAADGALSTLSGLIRQRDTTLQKIQQIHEEVFPILISERDSCLSLARQSAAQAAANQKKASELSKEIHALKDQIQDGLGNTINRFRQEMEVIQAERINIERSKHE